MLNKIKEFFTNAFDSIKTFFTVSLRETVEVSMGGLYILGILAAFTVGYATSKIITIALCFNVYALAFIFSVILASLIWALIMTLAKPVFREWRVVA